jgi:O-antigen/teichoic acid export membrane protein
MPAFISSIAAVIFSNIQFVILTVLKNPEATGIFGYAMMVISPLDLIPITLGGALFPIISNLSSRNAQKTQGYLLNLVIRYSLLITLPLAIFLSFFSKQLFSLFFPKYTAAAALFPFLIPGAIFFGIAGIFNPTIYALKKPKIARNIIVLGTLLFVILSIPLTQTLSSQGIALAYLLSTFAMFAISFIYVKKLLDLKIQVLSFVKFLFATGLFFVSLVISDLLSASLLMKILIVLLGSIFYVVLLFFLKFYIQEDVNVIKAIARRMPIMQKQVQYLAEFLEKHL